MSRYRIVYSRGSFGLVTLCDTHEKAMAEAQALQGTPGVWHVHIEDAVGTPVACDHDLRALVRAPAVTGGFVSCA